MAKIILNDGTEEYCSPGEARARVAAGEAVMAQAIPMYTTRQIVAETPKKRKTRKVKAEEPAEEPSDDESEDS